VFEDFHEKDYVEAVGGVGEGFCFDVCLLYGYVMFLPDFLG
jgi:hypothetical protein